MRWNKKFIWISLICVFICGSFLIGFRVSASESKRKVRVGFPIQSGLTYIDENGDYAGYTVDYLKELGKYTNWEYEFVEVEGDINEQLTTLLDMLETGEIDILGAMVYSDALEEIYSYPSYSYGTAYTTIAVKADADRWMEDDVKNWNGIRVAVYPAVQRRLEQLEKFAEVNGFRFEKVMCDTFDETVEAVEQGKADAIIQVDISMRDGFRAIARFSPSLYYFAVNKEETELLKEMNIGMSNLLLSYSHLQTDLYSKYFTSKGKFYISDESKEYIERLGTLNVLLFSGNAPIQYVKDGEVRGIAQSFFDELSEATGLKYHMVVADTYDEGSDLIRQGKVDLVAAIPGSVTLTYDHDLKLSFPYFESRGLIVSSADVLVPDKDRVQYMSSNIENEMNLLNSIGGRSTFLDGYCVNYYLNKKGVYTNLRMDWGDTDYIRYSVGYTSNADETLENIINSFCNSLTEDMKQEFLYSNSSDHAEYSIREWLSVYKWHILVFCVLAISVLMVMYIYWKNQILQRTQRENERFYQFSRLIGECLFDYDYKEDRISLQNNQILFPGQKIINHFMKDYEFFPFEDEDQRLCYDALKEMLKKHESQRDFRFNKARGKSWFRISAVYTDNFHAFGRFTDVNQDMKLKEELEKKASRDPLTGLFNRQALEMFIKDYLKDTNRGGIFILLDLDNFKCVNDMKGHTEGDELLIAFANFIDGFFRKTDIKSRLGGDEFVVFIPNPMDEDYLAKKLSEFIEKVMDEVFDPYRECSLSVSIGAAFITENIHSYEDLYKEADNAMYVAKFGGKNDFYISDGHTCTRRSCISCRQEYCRKREYLKAHHRDISDMVQEDI